MAEHAREAVDAVIVGAGAAGSHMAAILARAGKKVIVLEAGPRRTTGDLVSSQLWARRLKWSGPRVTESGANQVNVRFNSGFGTGGTALHHYGVWPRLHVEDFDEFSRYGRALDWPLGYADLRPYYDRVQAEIGLAGDAVAERWRPPGAPYPLPPVPLFVQGEILARGFAREGLHTAPIPVAILTRPYRGRAACLWDGWCDAGCPIGALANPLVTYLKEAEALGAEVRTDSPVTRILSSPNGAQANGVEYVAPTGELRRQYADVTILAAFAVQTPRLLLASAFDRHPEGLANSSGLVGRYIMTHNMAAVFGLFEEETQCYMGTTGGQLINQDGYAKVRPDGPYGSYQWLIAPSTKPNDLLGYANTRPDLIGADAADFLRRATRGFAKMSAVCEDLPLAENRVTLGPEVDGYGVPRAHVHHTTDPASVAVWALALEQGKRIMAAAGAAEVWSAGMGVSHILGGTLMGRDPARSVTNSYGQCHDIPNLVIVGASLFPSSGAVNPTYTIHAMVARAGEHLTKNWNTLLP